MILKTDLKLRLSVLFVIGIALLSTGVKPLRAANIPLPAHPRPDFERSAWMNLNGQWDFEVDPQDVGVREKWFSEHDFSKKITIPYVHQSKLSGLSDTKDYGQVWYRRTFSLPQNFQGKRIRLNVGAADYRATVWVNGKEVGTYEGGYTPFSFDITDDLKVVPAVQSAAGGTQNEVVIRVYDDAKDPAQPRGKQRPAGRNRWHYTHLTGIWQTVWLEAVGEKTIGRYQVTTEIDPPTATFEIFTEGTRRGEQVQVDILESATQCAIASGTARVEKGVAKLMLAANNAKLWSVETPKLYDIQMTLIDDKTPVDQVRSYLGFREVAARDGKFWLNGQPVWLSGPLDQGYYPDGLYTPPSDEAFIEDVQWVKDLGFNHIRKHQMVPDPRFLYHCDRMGLLVWGEMANAAEGHFSKRATDIALREWKRVIERDFNHPCLVTWVYSNENWMHGGPRKPQVEHYRKAYNQMKAWDPTRPVIDTSGYYHVESDIMDTHSYPPQKRLAMLYDWAKGQYPNPSSHMNFFVDIEYAGQPIIVSEWINHRRKHNFSSEHVDEWLPGYLSILGEFSSNPLNAGHCYVQLYDVENECNGYLTYDRKIKFKPETLAVLKTAHRQAAKRDSSFDWDGFIKKHCPEYAFLHSVKNDASAGKVILPTSQKRPAAWRYTLEQPADTWIEPGFDDTSWKKGPAPFGISNTPGLRPGTKWGSSDIWLRREFEFTGNTNKIQLLLAEIFHDEDAEIYINGTPALKVSGYTTSYVLKPIHFEGRMALKTGKNIIAVHCHQTSGGQGIDVGLVAATPEKVTLKAQSCELKAQSVNQRTGLLLEADGQILLTSPPEGLWSVATGWKDDWPTDWVHGSPEMVHRQGPWLVMDGSVQTDEGDWKIRDAYIAEDRLIRGVRRWTWTGKKPAKQVSLSVRFQSSASGAATFMPGICYYGNPADKPPRVARFNGKPGEELLCEEHRFAMPFISLEWATEKQYYGAALHSLPSLPPFANVTDQWWSLGGIGRDEATELTLLSGPCSLNGQHAFVKANQGRSLKYPDMWIDMPPGAVIEKTFYLEAYPVAAKGKGFQHSIRSSVELFHPYSTDGLPTFDEIIAAKYRFTVSRWHEDAESAGIRKYPHSNVYVMGWAGQAGAPGYALLALSDRLDDPKAIEMAQRLLDHLATSPFNKDGFMVRYNPDQNKWYGQDPISQGQGMENFARAIMTGRKMDNVDTSKWETFLKKACDIHAARILDSSWRPRSTNQGFLVSPLCKAYTLFGNEVYKRAATKAAEHYAARHLDMTEPYWGGTLDARCEDKEGAWAGFQAFLAMYEMSGDKKYLDWAEHAMDVTLSYTVVWDIDMPAGRLRDHNFKSRGWTVVSAQNQHLDVYGVLYTPEIYRMGQYLGREDLKKLAMVMYRTCGQLIDPFGSQGEQIQQTNFSQHGNTSNVTRMRGGYSEGWTVYWITAHFLNAAAQFEEMGIMETH